MRPGEVAAVTFASTVTFLTLGAVALWGANSPWTWLTFALACINMGVLTRGIRRALTPKRRYGPLRRVGEEHSR